MPASRSETDLDVAQRNKDFSKASAFATPIEGGWLDLMPDISASVNRAVDKFPITRIRIIRASATLSETVL